MLPMKVSADSNLEVSRRFRHIPEDIDKVGWRSRRRRFQKMSVEIFDATNDKDSRWFWRSSFQMISTKFAGRSQIFWLRFRNLPTKVPDDLYGDSWCFLWRYLTFPTEEVPNDISIHSSKPASTSDEVPDNFDGDFRCCKWRLYRILTEELPDDLLI